MIYRILVDHRHHTTRRSEGHVVLTERSFQELQQRLPSDVLQKTRPLKNKRFITENDLGQAVTKALGHRDSIDFSSVIADSLVERITQEQHASVPWPWQEYQSMIGASYGFLADVMQKRGLRRPSITNPRARFYFTEAGWETVGRHVAAEARRLGHLVKVIKRKEPKRSQVIYRDELQLALVPVKSGME
jgi:hypothetical protein